MAYGAQIEFATANRVMMWWSALISVVLLCFPLAAGAGVPNPTVTGPIPANVKPGDPSHDYPQLATSLDLARPLDLASLGYVLVEMLSGVRPFAGIHGIDELVEAKRSLLTRLNELLPVEVVRCEQLMGLVRGLVHPDPARRFPDADAADLVEQGAAGFQRQLVRSNLASEYTVEIRTWLAALG